MAFYCSRKNNAFTLAELLVVVTIMGLITGIGVASYNSFHNKKLVESAGRELETNLRSAQSKAVNVEKDCLACLGTNCGTINETPGTLTLESWFVEIGQLSYQIYGRCNASSLRFGEKNVTLPRGVENIGYTGTIGFIPLGGTDLSSDVTLTLSDGHASNDISISVSQGGDIH